MVGSCPENKKQGRLGWFGRTQRSLWLQGASSGVNHSAFDVHDHSALDLPQRDPAWRLRGRTLGMGNFIFFSQWGIVCMIGQNCLLSATLLMSRDFSDKNKSKGMCNNCNLTRPTCIKIFSGIKKNAVSFSFKWDISWPNWVFCKVLRKHCAETQILLLLELLFHKPLWSECWYSQVRSDF